jgi:hypothetical protein
MPGIGELIDGAIQQAAQPARQDMAETVESDMACIVPEVPAGPVIRRRNTRPASAA